MASFMNMNKIVTILNLGLYTSFRTKAGMTSAAESITESLRRTRQLMVQVSRYYCCVFCFEWDAQLIYFLNLYVLIGGGKKYWHTHGCR
jgi:hypothetical protein